jgi:hypothetical protein
MNVIRVWQCPVRPVDLLLIIKVILYTLAAFASRDCADVFTRASVIDHINPLSVWAHIDCTSIEHIIKVFLEDRIVWN